MADSLREQVLMAAWKLFMERGYEAVGMRDIANAVGRQPVQAYRLNLAKADILAELIIELNQEQIKQLPQLRAHERKDFVRAHVFLPARTLRTGYRLPADSLGGRCFRLDVVGRP
jgi:AcrR family transcriptional regulator